MGNKLFVVGVTILLAFPLFGVNQTFLVAGAIIATIGAIAVVLDR